MGVVVSSNNFSCCVEFDKKTMKHNQTDYQKLAEKYPDFFKMHFGFECGPGWYKIIEKLTDDINAIIQRDKLENFYATTVKEKYGTLRYYMSIETDEMSDLIEKAEDETEITCEVCGNPGQMSRNGYWLAVRCNECQE